MPEFRFIEDGHRYMLGDMQLPSVTQVLPHTEWGNEDAMKRGSRVHRMVELYNNNALNENSLDARLKPYLRGYIKFRWESQNKIIGALDIKSGVPYPSAELQVAAYAILINQGLPKYEGGQSYEIPRYHPAFLFAGTPDIIIMRKPPIIHLYALHLKSDGTYKLYNYSRDLVKNKNLFLSFLATYRWKQEKGLLNGSN